MIFNFTKILIIKFILLFIILFSFSGSLYPNQDTTKNSSKKKTNYIPKKYIFPSLTIIADDINALPEDKSVNKNPANDWLPLMRKIRNFEIPKDEAIIKMNELVISLSEFAEKKGVLKVNDSEWIFPVKGYSPSAIGGRNGSGYVVSNFDFFDKNTGGHPAHDIFIADRNQDNIDDVTGKPVEILSMTPGIVVETRKDWVPSMDTIKGGNIVYIFDNDTKSFFYYAHMDQVYVNVGDIVTPGFILGTLGRTGKNAYPQRSPTHLHLMCVKSYDGNLLPFDIYTYLLNARLIE